MPPIRKKEPYGLLGSRFPGLAYSDELGHDLHASDDPPAEQEGLSDFLFPDFLASPLRA